MFAGLAELEKQYFQDKLALFIAVGPVTQLSHTRLGFFHFLADIYNVIEWAWRTFHINEVSAANELRQHLSYKFCSTFEGACLWIMHLFTSDDSTLDNPTRNVVKGAHYPNGASMKQVLHFGQNIRTGRFQKWSDDFHHQPETEEFALESISEVPIAIFCGKNDLLADCIDASWTRDKIGERVVFYDEIPASHLSFQIGKNMDWFSETAMGLIQDYHPIVDMSFLQ
jgi:hypothetical protein